LIIWHRRKLALFPDGPTLRRMLRFGFPTMPAELSLYSLNFIDRILVARFLGLAEAGLYSLAVKISQSVNVLVRGFQLAFPPLAYSITDDDEARQAYSVIVTWFAVLMAFVVTAIWLLAPWVVRIFAAPDFFPAVEAVGPVAAGTALYAVYMVLLVVLGRTGRTEFNFPATLAGVATNIVLNVLLLPPLGILGAGVALVCSYMVVLVLMFIFTQRLFPVPYEWGRLAKAVIAASIVIAVGLAFVPDDGFGPLALRILLVLALPVLMLAFDFFTPVEKRYLRMLARPREFAGRLKKEAAEGREEEFGLPEVYEVEQMNEDMRG
jgi:O-antigen/teichoic acid export membrane protein